MLKRLSGMAGTLPLFDGREPVAGAITIAGANSRGAGTHRHY
jgi:hypothetical protein